MPTNALQRTIFAGVLLLTATPAFSQDQQIKRFDQDPALNNLVHPEGYQTCEPGDLGEVRVVGDGPTPMILIAGFGFDGHAFDAFMESRKDDYTMYAITLAGSGGTPAPPMPPDGTSYGELSWTMAAVDGVRELMRTEGIEQPVIVTHWFTATQVGLRLALDSPDDIAAVVCISGVGRYTDLMIPPGITPAQRAQAIDGVAQNWFRTVTRDTWDDNNFLPGDYAIHPVRALQLWREAAAPDLPVWVRYLCEAMATDIIAELNGLRVPTLVLQPGFDEDFYAAEGLDYMRSYCVGSWEGAAEKSDALTITTIEDSRVFQMDDQPERLDEAVNAFLASIES